jgi:hypothetical protein
VHHFKSFKAKIDHPNVHIFHYADMRRDLPGHTRRLACLLGLDIDDATLEAIAASMRFENMQANARTAAAHSARRSATFKDPAAFFDSASNRKWTGKLTEDDVAAFQSRLAGLLSERDAHWLQFGGELPA